MKTKLAVLLLAFAVGIPASQGAVPQLIERMPEDTLAVLVTEDAADAFRRALTVVEESPLPIPDDVRNRLPGFREMAGMLQGPAILGGDVQGWGAIAKLNAPGELVRGLLLQVPGAQPEDDVMERAVSFPVPGGERVFAVLRQGELFVANSGGRLARVMDASREPRDCEIADFYAGARLARRAPGGVALVVESRVARAPAQHLGRLTQAEVAPAWAAAAEQLAEAASGPMALLWSWGDQASAFELVAAVEPHGTPWEMLNAPRDAERLAAISVPAGHIAVAGDFSDGAAWLRAAEIGMSIAAPARGAGPRERLAAYGETLGIDFERDLLGALDGAWSVALEVGQDGPRPVRLEAGVRDAERLKKSLSVLAAAREVPWNEGDVVRTTLLGEPLHAIRFTPDRLRADYTGEVPSADAERAAWVDDPAFALALQAPSPPAMAVHLTVQDMLAAAPAEARAELEPALEALREMLVTASVRDGTASLRLDAKPGVEQMVFGAVGLARQRREVLGADNLRQIGLALALYAGRHDGDLPVRLIALAPDYVPHAALRCPITGPFVYYGRGMNADAPGADDAIAAATARPGPDGQRWALFLDGQVQAMDENEFERRIAEQARTGAALLRPRGEPTVEAADPYDEGVTWLGYAWGALMAGPQGEREFRGVLGEEEPQATAFAFTQDAVWMATLKGLFQWNRTHRFWARVAVGGIFFDAPVLELAVDNSRLRAVVEVEGQHQTQTFDLERRRWQ